MHDENANITRLEWMPSPSQYARYRQREVELARANLRLLGKRTLGATTLHSVQTIQRAIQDEGVS